MRMPAGCQKPAGMALTYLLTLYLSARELQVPEQCLHEVILYLSKIADLQEQGSELGRRFASYDLPQIITSRLCPPTSGCQLGLDVFG